MIPRADVINAVGKFNLAENFHGVGFLLCSHHARADKGRVADDVIGLRPVDVQGVGLNDIRVAFEREKFQAFVDNFFGLAFRLELGNPQRGLRDAHGEIIYFNAVKIFNADFNRVVEFADDNLLVEFF